MLRRSVCSDGDMSSVSWDANPMALTTPPIRMRGTAMSAIGIVQRKAVGAVSALAMT